jgi:hypothetical protein
MEVIVDDDAWVCMSIFVMKMEKLRERVLRYDGKQNKRGDRRDFDDRVLRKRTIQSGKVRKVTVGSTWVR